MTSIEGVSSDGLRDALDRVESAKAAKRLMVALAYVDGVPVDEMSERYGIPRSTVYYWLSRFEDRPIRDAISDRDRPGRPTELDRDVLEQVVDAGPDAYDVDVDADADVNAESWTPAALRAVLEREYDVSYSEGHVRRLLAELSD